MENKIIVGNIKMNMKFGEIPNYLKDFENIDNKNLVICPSNIYIPYFLDHKFSVGSQDVSCFNDGSYTGEVSAAQLSSIGVEYVIVGHSERRINLKETDLDINKKIKNSLACNLKVILCIGETSNDVMFLKKDKVLLRQIRDGLIGIDNFDNVIIAYEPIWSIGTNKLPNIKELDKTIKFIKQTVYSLYKKKIKVIYGGSINENNIAKINTIDSLDGFLIGSASIIPKKFLEIMNKI